MFPSRDSSEDVRWVPPIFPAISSNSCVGNQDYQSVECTGRRSVNSMAAVDSGLNKAYFRAPDSAKVVEESGFWTILGAHSKRNCTPTSPLGCSLFFSSFSVILCSRNALLLFFPVVSFPVSGAVLVYHFCCLDNSAYMLGPRTRFLRRRVWFQLILQDPPF